MRVMFLNRGDWWKALGIATTIEILLFAHWESTGGLKGGPNSLAWLQMPGLAAVVFLESVWRTAPDMIEFTVFFATQISLLSVPVIAGFAFWRAYQDAKHTQSDTY